VYVEAAIPAHHVISSFATTCGKSIHFITHVVVSNGGFYIWKVLFRGKMHEKSYLK